MEHEDVFNIADAMLNLKYEIIITNLVVVCLAIVAIYFHARIKKSAELKEINNNFTTVIEQQRALTTETGKIKQSLDKESINYQIRLNAYNDKSIEAVNDIYVLLIKLRDASIEVGYHPSAEEQQIFFSIVRDFKNTFDTKKIWIPSSLASHIEDVAIELDNRSHKFIIASTRIDNVSNISDDRMNALIDEQERYFDYIHKEIKVVFDRLVEKITNTIGA